MKTAEKVYAAPVWAHTVKKNFNYECTECGSAEDVQAVHITPPSLGGRNTLDNGISLCLRCRSKRILPHGKVRFNFSAPRHLADRLEEYCTKMGRSMNDVIKQLMADFLFSGLDRFLEYRNGCPNDYRVSVPVLRSVLDDFSKQCDRFHINQGSAIRSMLHNFLSSFERAGS